MNAITILFVKRPWWNPMSALIRWALPVSRFKWARACHSIVVDGDMATHATMLHGVVRQPLADALKGQIVVERRDYLVPDAAAGIDWAITQVGKPYDFQGAFGLSLSPDRKWAKDDAWFCHEFSARVVQSAGRRLFAECGHVTDTAMLLVDELAGA